MKTAKDGVEYSDGRLWFRCIITHKTVCVPFSGDHHNEREIYAATSAYYRELRRMMPDWTQDRNNALRGEKGEKMKTELQKRLIRQSKADVRETKAALITEIKKSVIDYQKVCLLASSLRSAQCDYKDSVSGKILERFNEFEAEA